MGFTQFTGEPNIFCKSFRAQWQAVGTSSWGIRRGPSHLLLIRRSSVPIYEPARGFVLSMQIWYDRNKGLLQFDQRFSITSLAVKYGVKDLQCRTMPITSEVDLPRLAVAEVNSNEYLSIIGSCLHISQVSRPDIAYAVGVLSRHSSTPGQQHMETAINLDWSHRKSIEERLRAQSLKQFLCRQKSTLMPITRGTTLPDEVLQVC